MTVLRGDAQLTHIVEVSGPEKLWQEPFLNFLGEQTFRGKADGPMGIFKKDDPLKIILFL